MKSAFVELPNVNLGKAMIKSLLTRDRKRLPGMMTITGATGSGKSAFVEHTTFNASQTEDWFYYRLLSTDTRKSFLTELLSRLLHKFKGEDLRGNHTVPYLERQCISLLQAHPNTVVVIDEINLATSNKRWFIVEIIRDLADSTWASFIMVGESDVLSQIGKYDLHVLNRIRWNCRFSKPDISTYRLLVDEILEVEMDDDVLEFTFKKTLIPAHKGAKESAGGDLHSVMKLWESLENDAKNKGIKKLTSKNVSISR